MVKSIGHSELVRGLPSLLAPTPSRKCLVWLQKLVYYLCEGLSCAYQRVV